MKFSFRLPVALLLVAMLTAGCAVNRATATAETGTNLESLKTVHVKKFEPDERGIDQLIADNLRKRGYSVTTGTPQPGNVDFVVTYIDKWMWDITMYMLELTITVREPKTDYPLATGNSYHTSLTRKSPTEMVDEVVGNIIKESKAKK